MAASGAHLIPASIMPIRVDESLLAITSNCSRAPFPLCLRVTPIRLGPAPLSAISPYARAHFGQLDGGLHQPAFIPLTRCNSIPAHNSRIPTIRVPSWSSLWLIFPSGLLSSQWQGVAGRQEEGFSPFHHCVNLNVSDKQCTIMPILF